ncbi:hypothetical protein ACTFHD_06635, partial [Campylobacter jejuni]
LLTHFLSPEFETLLVAGYPTANEKQADSVLEKFGVKPVYMREMGRELNPLSDYAAYLKIKKLVKDFKPDIVH